MSRIPNAKIRGWLAENNVGYKEFAEATGIAFSTLKDKMRGATDWKLEEIKSVLDYTGKSFDELFRN